MMKTTVAAVVSFLLFINIQQLNCVDESDDDYPLSRSFIRLHLPSVIGRNCEVDGIRGSCQRRNNCLHPSDRMCRRGIVCCLPEQEEPPKTPKPPRPRPTTPRTEKPKPTVPRTVKPKPTVPSTVKPKPTDGDISDGGNVDIVFPGCGYRYPSAPEPDDQSTLNRRNNDDDGGGSFLGGPLFRRFGKREISSYTCNGTLCGQNLSRKKRQIRPVIVGGVTTGPEGYPWMTALFKKTRSERFLCGASIISKRYVLTAAHCFDGLKNLPSQKFTVRMGSPRASDGTLYDIERVTVHPNYKDGQYYNDMALLRVSREIRLTTKTFPICLPSPSLQNQLIRGRKNVMVMGWGDTSFGGRASKELMEAELPIVPVKECNASYATVAKSNFPKGITNLFICAGFKEGGKDACQGDSGGPLVMRMKSNAYVQLGIVSFGYGCAQAGYPGVYTRVSKFTKWIQDNTDL